MNARSEIEELAGLLKQLDTSQQMGLLMMIESAQEVQTKQKRRISRRSRLEPL